MKRILIVDDEPAILLSFQKLLRFPNAEIEVADTVEKALSCLSVNYFDVVILDVRFSGSDGREGLCLLRQIKRHHRDTRIIMLTGYGSPEIMGDAYGLGADYYYEKPVSYSVLRRALETLGVDGL